MEQLIDYKDRYQLAFSDVGDKHGFPVLIQHGLIATISDTQLFDRLLDMNVRLILPKFLMILGNGGKSLQF